MPDVEGVGDASDRARSELGDHVLKSVHLVVLSPAGDS